MLHLIQRRVFKNCIQTGNLMEEKWQLGARRVCKLWMLPMIARLLPENQMTSYWEYFTLFNI